MINETGKSVNGFGPTPEGVVVEVYKDWVYVSNAESPADSLSKGSFASHTVMHVHEGNIKYLDTVLSVGRGPTDEVYCFAVCGDRAMLGIGYYDPDRVLTAGEVEQFRAWVKSRSNANLEWVDRFVDCVPSDFSELIRSVDD